MESNFFDPDVKDLSDELYAYILATLTKANERPSPVVAKEMTEEIIRRVSMVATTPPVSRGRIFNSAQSRQANVLQVIDKAIVDMPQGDKGDPI